MVDVPAEALKICSWPHIVPFETLAYTLLCSRGGHEMFDSALAFNRYRLEVVRNWPPSEAKEKLIAAIECSLQKSEGSGQPRRPEDRDLIAGARNDGTSGF